jgi:hypothetical protein
MFAEGILLGPEGKESSWTNSIASRKHILLLAVLAIAVVACQGDPSVSTTEQWTPPYLQLHLSVGKAQVQSSDDSEWKVLESETTITVEETLRVVADAVTGAQFLVGNDSMLELKPGVTLELQNPHSFPRLQVILENGDLLFVAREPSYEFLVSGFPVSLLSIPSQIEIEVNGDTARVGVEEGAVALTIEEEMFTISACREIFLSPGQEPQVTEFCATVAETPPASTPLLAPSPTPWQVEQTMTPSPSPSPTTTATPIPSQTPTSVATREMEVPTLTYTPVPPTETSAPPSPKKNPPTQPPPTQPPPTQPPPTQPPPTQPPPTQPPPTRVPPTEPRPTLPSPSEPLPTASPE